MFLSDLHKGDRGKIIAIHASKALRDRFNSFGLVQGEELVIKTCSIARQTMSIVIGSTNLVLRADEAQKIEVEKIDQ